MDSYETIEVKAFSLCIIPVKLNLNNGQALHKSLPTFSPYIPVALLPYIALVLLSLTFTLAFYFSTYAFYLIQATSFTKIIIG